MAKQASKPQESQEELLSVLNQNFATSRDAFQVWRDQLDERERLLYGQPKESTNKERANVNDPRLFAQAFERSIRVMSQTPTGKFKGVSSDDTGKNMLMNLIVDRYVIPNANRQFDFLTKLRMIDWYSLAYGSMVAYVDWCIDKKTGYIGPELYLIPIRNVYPQSGVSFADMDYCQIEDTVSLDFLRSKLKKEQNIWNKANISRILEMAKDTTGQSVMDKDADAMSFNEKKYSTSAQNTVKFPRFKIRTEYRRDRWITYAPDYDIILRDIPNPHGNNQLPIVAKYCIPQIDFAFGLSELEVSASMAELINSLYNLAIDDAKNQLYPTIMIDPGSVVPSTIEHGAAKIWLLNGKDARSPEIFSTNSRGATSALEMRNMAISSIQTLAGTSDTSVDVATESTMGKTPQALKMQEARQSSRDEIDRFYMEQFISDVYRRFANLIVRNMHTDITLRLFASEIEQLAPSYPDILELVGETTGPEGSLVNIPHTAFDGYQFDYDITPGSTYKIDQQTQAQNLQFILELAQSQGVQQALSESGKQLDIAETIQKLLTNSGIQDPDKILIDKAPEPQPEEMAQAVPEQAIPQEQLAAYQNIEQMPVEPQQVVEQNVTNDGRDVDIAAMEQAINQSFGGTQ